MYTNQEKRESQVIFMAPKKNSFIVQASILAMAGIVVRIIGMLYRSPLTSIIGDEGNGYYSQAYNIYTIILLISSYSIPLAVSRAISSKLVFKEYKNAHRIFQCAIIYVIIVGTIASLATWFFAPMLVDSNAVVVLQVFAPTIFFSGLLGVFRGYFQAHGTMVHTSISQIIEQLLNAVVSIACAYYFTQYCIEQGQGKRAPVYGATGSAIGTGAGVLIGLCFMTLVYMLNRGYFKKRIQKDKHSRVDSYSSIFKVILLTVTPVIFSTFIYNCSSTLDMKFYLNIMQDHYGWTEEIANTQYGIFSTKFIVLMNIPVALASSFSTAMIPGVSGSYTAGEIEKTRNKVQDTIRFTMFLTIPSAVGLAVLAKPIMLLLFPQKESLGTAVALLQCGAICVIFYSLSTITNGVLQGIGKMHLPVRNALVALIVHLGVLIPALYFTDLNLYALVLATGVYALTMCVMNAFSVGKCLSFRTNVKKAFVLPSIASLVMGAAAYGMYYISHQLLKSNVISLFLAILFAVLVYAVCLLKIKAVTEHELLRMPKGKLLIRIFKKLHLL